MNRRKVQKDLARLLEVIEELEAHEDFQKMASMPQAKEVSALFGRAKLLTRNCLKEASSRQRKGTKKEIIPTLARLTRLLGQLVDLADRLREFFNINCKLLVLYMNELLIENIGRRLRDVRLRAGMKQKSLAQALEIHSPLLSMYEQGKREPSITFLVRFSSHFGMTLSALFQGVEETRKEKKRSVGTLLAEMRDLIESIESATGRTA